MNAGEIRTSCNGCFQFTIQVDGNLVVYKNSAPKQVVWSPNIYGKGVVKICMQDDGNLVAYTSSMAPIWSSGWYMSNVKTGAYARIQDDGQFVVIFGSAVKYTTSITSSCPAGIITTLAPVTTTLAPVTTTTLARVTSPSCNDAFKAPQCLNAGEIRTSCNGCFQFTIQVDGNLVVYKNSVPKQVLWSPNIYGNGVVKVCMQIDGNLVAYTSSMVPIWASNTQSATSQADAIARIQDDGQFVVSYNGLTKYTTNSISSCPANTNLSPVTTLAPTVTNVPSTSSKFLKKYFLTVNINIRFSIEVFLCYWPSWSPVLLSTNPSLCSHVSFAFFDVSANGAITPQDDPSSFLALNNSIPSTKLLISLGGQTGPSTDSFSTIAGSANLRQTLASNILSYIQSNNLHGGAKVN